MSPERKRNRKNIVTPEKIEPASQPAAFVKHAALSIDECDHGQVDVFEYDVSCEDVNPEGAELTCPTSTFNYDSPSETESDISAGFGGWLTNDRIKPSTGGNKENLPPEGTVVVSPLASYLQDRHPSAENTIPRFPLLPRNDYGGIRDCLPPEQLARWISTTSANAAIMEASDNAPEGEVAANELSTLPQHKTTFTAEQLLRMEHNRLEALEKLRAKSGK